MPPFRLPALCALLLLAAAAPAEAQNAPSTIPLTLNESSWGGGRIFVTARFGNKQGPMRLDTGASTTRVMLAPWNREWPALGRSASIGSSGRAISCDDVEAQNVALPASQGNDVGRASLTVTRCAAGEGDLLGLNFFRSARFSLDFGKRELTFFPQVDTNAKPKPFRRLTPERSLVGIDLRIGREAVVGFLDTGAELCAVDRAFVARRMQLFTLVRRRLGASGASGGNFSPDLYKIKSIDLGDGLILRDVYALVYDFGMLREALGRGTPLILGYNLVSRLHWDLDFSSPDAPTWSARLK
jgi:Aspartyl protease